jgi:hypothetical protein
LALQIQHGNLNRLEFQGAYALLVIAAREQRAAQHYHDSPPHFRTSQQPNDLALTRGRRDAAIASPLAAMRCPAGAAAC